LQTSDKLSKKLLLGYSTNSTRNIVLSKENGWFAFTVNNKIVVEFLEESRSQIILDEHLDEISVKIISLIINKFSFSVSFYPRTVST
jgi:hypothetical protein